MSVEEAKQVTVSMAKETFVPPPRRIDDILAILYQRGQFDPEVAVKIKSQADALPPDTDDSVALANFYKKRGAKAVELGRSKQALDDIRTALRYAETKEGEKLPSLEKKDYSKILGALSLAESLFGNFPRAIELEKRALEIEPDARVYMRLAKHYLLYGDFKAAEKVERAGIRYCNEKIKKTSEKWRNLYVNFKHSIEANSLDIKGNHAKAEPLRRSVAKNSVQYYQDQFPEAYLIERHRLAENLRRQGRLVEAEIEIRETTTQSVGFGGKKSPMLANHLFTLARILLWQERVDDAEKIAKTSIGILKASGLSDESLLVAKGNWVLGNILVARNNFTAAMKQFDRTKESWSDNHYLYEKFMAMNPNVLISLLKTGRTDEAMRSIAACYNNFRKYLGETVYRTAEILGIRAMAYAKLGDKKQAVKDFSKSITILLEKEVSEYDYSKYQRFKILVEAYIDLLTQIYDDMLEKEFEIDASAEIFKLFQAVSTSMVHKAVGESGARAAAVNLRLADFVRREQDANKQLNALQTILSDLLALPLDQQNPNAIKDLKNRIDSLGMARTTLNDEIKKLFPKYSNFIKPPLFTLSITQKHLKSGEALVVIYPSFNRSFIWLISKKKPVKFSIVQLGEKEANRIVTHLRKSLDSKPKTFGDIPEFDLKKAYELYAKLLKPLEIGWKDAKDLLVIAPGPLGQLPFSVIPTCPVRLSDEKGELFANYRQVPWLIREVSITRYPSVATFAILRKLSEGDPNRKAFVGFGDPFFNHEQIAQVKEKTVSKIPALTSQKESIQIRGIRITQTGNLDSETITTSHIGMLNRLPDTAEEIRSIAGATGADLDHDIFLGRRASEHKVKTMNLADRRIIAFATHALVPGDLDGLDQPALALCSPMVTGEKEDGLLTMGEILKLKLNADWVVLSACNTGAADGAGAEAVSGLGRAFFYAGTRAILVSMWPVETTSARKLTTGLFRYQQEDKRLSRARALQKSMLALIDGAGLKDDATGKVIASYAHPIFWAPFIVVGESGCNAN
jgi:CHAT domain-containing protein